MHGILSVSLLTAFFDWLWTEVKFSFLRALVIVSVTFPSPLLQHSEQDDCGNIG
jgi:hypothetical protein